jgi:Uma2 family endonuclease
METTLELTPYELERGKPMPSRNHARLEPRLTVQLAKTLASNQEVFVELSLELPGGNVTPDLAVLPAEPSDWLNDEIRVTQAPQTAVEILSPTQSLNELLEKLEIYFGAGTQSVWVVIPPLQLIRVYYDLDTYQTFEVAEVLTDEKLGVSLNLSDLFR